MPAADGLTLVVTCPKGEAEKGFELVAPLSSISSSTLVSSPVV